MKERTLKILKYLTVPCMFGCLTLSAGESGDSNEMKSSCKSSCHEKTVKPSCDEINGSQDKEHFVSTYDRIRCKEITPDAGPNVSNGADVYVQADYIYWHASEGGLVYAETSGTLPTAATATSNNVLQTGVQLAPHFKMNSGFKAGIGIDFHYDGWDMGLNYTWLRTHAGSSFGAASAGTANVGVWDGAYLVNPLTASGTQITDECAPVAGSGHWRLHFNVLDLELGRSFFISPKLVLRPHYGLKGTWDTQNFVIRYENSGIANPISGVTSGSNGLTSVAVTEYYTIYNKQNYWGLGARAGLNTSWMVSKNFSFFGNWALTALWGQFKSSRYDYSYVVLNTTGANVLSGYTPVNERARTHLITPVLETEIGLRYDYWFCDDDYRFRLAVSWENQLWFNQNQFITQDNSGILGDLSLQGLTVNVRFDF